MRLEAVPTHLGSILKIETGNANAGFYFQNERQMCRNSFQELPSINPEHLIQSSLDFLHPKNNTFSPIGSPRNFACLMFSKYPMNGASPVPAPIITIGLDKSCSGRWNSMAG